MGSRADRKGLHDLGKGSWAYLLPDSGWSWSNGELDLTVGVKRVRQVDVPGDQLVYIGNIIFHQWPILNWAGPINNWPRARYLMLSWDVETIVPGQGPIADRNDVSNFCDYLTYLHNETRARYDTGLSFQEAGVEGVTIPRISIRR